MATQEDDRRFVAERRLVQREGDYARAAQYVGAQSKWMVAQLFLANSGALVALASSDQLRPHLFSAGGWFVAGIAFAGLCGLGTWIHAMLITSIQWDWMNPQGVVDPAFEYPSNKGSLRWANAVFWLAVAFGAISLGAFVMGACRVGQG